MDAATHSGNKDVACAAYCLRRDALQYILPAAFTSFFEQLTIRQ